MPGCRELCTASERIHHIDDVVWGTWLCHVIMASSDSESDWDRQSSNHSDNSCHIFDDDNQEEKDLEYELEGIFPYRFEPYISDKEDSEEEPTIPVDLRGCKMLNGTVLSCISHKQVNTGLKFIYLEANNCI